MELWHDRPENGLYVGYTQRLGFSRDGCARFLDEQRAAAGRKRLLARPLPAKLRSAFSVLHRRVACRPIKRDDLVG